MTIGFADADGARQGVAIAGAGTLLCLGGAVTGAPEAQMRKDADGAWTASVDGRLEIALEPLGPAAQLGALASVWICSARGTIAGERFDGVGHLTRDAPGDRAPLERSVTAWLGAELALALAARRPRRAAGHGDEELHATVLRGDPLTPAAVRSPRLSSAYDGDGRLARCNVELWETEEAEFALRFGALATAHGELAHADGARTQVAFLAWRGDRERGVGRYDITRR